jgi:hypothetical protein
MFALSTQSYCSDNNTLTSQKVINYNNQTYSFSEDVYCRNGCDNVTLSCNPEKYVANIGTFAVIIIVIVGIILLYSKYGR